jgi:lipoprotein-anchoring transpeptidase ErfK/SrfK
MMASTRKARWSSVPWKAGLFLAAAVAVVQFVPSPVPARQAPAPAAEAPPPRFDMIAPAEAATPAAPPSRAEPAAAPREPVAVADYPVRAELPVGRMLDHGEWAWTQGRVPATGETLVVVNLRAQLLSLYRDGEEIGRARIVYGADEKPTPTGTFPILEKDAVHFSNLYGNAPMPYMLRLTRDGVAIHGSEVAPDVVTHGCVGLPKAFAAMLFRQVKVGDRVVVWRG